MRIGIEAFEPDRVSLSVGFNDQEPTTWTFMPLLGGQIDTSHPEMRASYAAYVMGYPLAYMLSEELVIDVPSPKSVVERSPLASNIFAFAASRMGWERPAPPAVSFTKGTINDFQAKRFAPDGDIGYILPFSMGVDSSYMLMKAQEDHIPNLRVFINNIDPQDNAPGGGDHLWVRAPEFQMSHALPEKVGGLSQFKFLQQFWFNSWWAGVSALVFPPPAVILYTATYWYGAPSDAYGYTQLAATSPWHLYSLSMAGYQPLYVHGSTNRGQRIRGIANKHPEWLPHIRSCWSNAYTNCGRCEKCALNFLGMAAYGVPTALWSFREDPLLVNRYLSGDNWMSEEGEDAARFFAKLVANSVAKLSSEKVKIVEAIRWMLQ
jgi:hypothetical protein